MASYNKPQAPGKRRRTTTRKRKQIKDNLLKQTESPFTSTPLATANKPKKAPKKSLFKAAPKATANKSHTKSPHKPPKKVPHKSPYKSPTKSPYKSPHKSPKTQIKPPPSEPLFKSIKLRPVSDGIPKKLQQTQTAPKSTSNIPKTNKQLQNKDNNTKTSKQSKATANKPNKPPNKPSKTPSFKSIFKSVKLRPASKKTKTPNKSTKVTAMVSKPNKPPNKSPNKPPNKPPNKSPNKSPKVTAKKPKANKPSKPIANKTSKVAVIANKPNKSQKKSPNISSKPPTTKTQTKTASTKPVPKRPKSIKPQNVQPPKQQTDVKKVKIAHNPHTSQSQNATDDQKTVSIEAAAPISTISDSVTECEKFLESERVYVKNGLRIGYEVFFHRLEIHNKLNDAILSDDEIQALFGNYAMLYNVNRKLLEDLLHIRLNQGSDALRDNLGEIMVKFIPYFRMYSDYIVKKRTAITKLDALKKSNKKFAQFVKINEMCVKRKLKSFLEEPAVRIMQYLQYLGNIYAGHKTDIMLQSIMDIKKVTDEIAIKCRDNKSRQLVGQIQSDLFGNKIQLLAAHRLCIAYCTMNLLLNQEKKIKTCPFILCNDIFLIGSAVTKFKSGNLISVHPLIGLRVVNIDWVEYKFSLLPANIVAFAESTEKMEKWIKMIQEAVDEQEHSLKQCNVVDLEKRLRKQKTSKEGQSDTINITNPARIRQIEIWRNKKFKVAGSGNSGSGSKSVAQSKVKVTAKPRVEASKNKTKPVVDKKENVNSVSVAKRKVEKVEEEKEEEYVESDGDDDGVGGEVVGENNKEINRRNDGGGHSKAMSSRMSLMSGITGFNNKSLKRVDSETLRLGKSEPEAVDNLLQSTLKNYRKFVMDDDDDESDSDNEWSD